MFLVLRGQCLWDHGEFQSFCYVCIPIHLALDTYADTHPVLFLNDICVQVVLAHLWNIHGRNLRLGIH